MVNRRVKRRIKRRNKSTMKSRRMISEAIICVSFLALFVQAWELSKYFRCPWICGCVYVFVPRVEP